MNPEMSNKQLVRLNTEAVRAIDLFRKATKKVAGKTPSINKAINLLILAGYESSGNADPVQLEQARKAVKRSSREAQK